MIVQGFMSYSQDMAKFTQHLRDFLVESKEVAGEDMANIYLVERKRKADLAEQNKQAMLQNIQGMQNPYQLAEDDDMA